MNFVIFCLSRLFPSYFGLKWSYDGVFKFFEFFWYFCLIFYYGMARKRSQRFYFLLSLFLGISQFILAWKDAMMVCPNFLKCFAIFLKFSITCRVGTHRNDVFYFLSFLVFPILYWLEKKLWWCFLIFWFFLLFFFEFSILSCVETHRNDFYYFLSFTAFPNLFWLEKKLWWCILFEVFCYFFGIFYYGSGRNSSEQFFYFYFLSFLAFPILFWLEKKLCWCFLIFWIFLLFFWNFLFWVMLKPIGTIFIIFSLSRPFPSYFGVKWSYDGVFKFFEFFWYFCLILYCGMAKEHIATIFFFFIFSFSQPFPIYFGLKRGYDGVS